MSQFCHNCGNPLSENSLFCPECGIKLEPFQNPEKKEEIKHESNTSITSNKKKKGGCFKIVGLILLGILAVIIIGSIILYNLSDDWEDTSIKNGLTNNAEIIQEPKSLKKAAIKMEAIFIEADTTQLKLLLTDTSFKTYNGVYSEIQPYMNEYAKAFKNRKLIKLNDLFALYSFEDEEGNKFTVEFASVTSDEWKLIRF